MSTRPSAPKKVRLACQRCRTRRIKCDGQVPACTNCAKAGQVCLDVDSQNSGIVIPRNFATAARERIQWLETIIRDRLPDVDLRSGPQVDASLDLEAPETPALPVATSAPRLSQKRSADAVQAEQDGSFPERAHSIAMNLGMLSLNSDSPQKHYLGSSSGLLFTNLIGASPSSTASTPQETAVPAQAGDADWYEGPREQAKQYCIDMYAFLKQVSDRSIVCKNLPLSKEISQELPPRHDALLLVHTYTRWIHPDFPVIEPSGIFSALDAIYDCLQDPLLDDDFRNGWPIVAFTLFMILNIGAIVKVRSRIYEYPPQRYYRAAIHFSKDAFSQISLPSLQGLVMLVVHSMLTPAEVNLWTLVHLALAYCVEIGVHREQAELSASDFTYQQVRRFTFFTIYSLDRSISSIQGRPLGFRDETFDIQMPQPPAQLTESRDSPIPPSFAAAVTHYSIYKFKLDRIVSDIKLHLYHLPGESSWFPWPKNSVEHQERIKDAIQNWWDDVRDDPFDFACLDSRQRQVWRLKLKVKYHSTMILLFQPSQVIPSPSAHALGICLDSASGILNGYQRLHDLQSLDHGWRAVLNIFAAGATLIYSFWTSEQVRKNASAADMAKDLRTCSSLLTVGGEWWPSAKTGQRSFGLVADLTMRKLYMDNGASKAPRLTADSSSPGWQSNHRAGHGEQSIQVLSGEDALERLDHLPLDETWQHMDHVVTQDGQVTWHGAGEGAAIRKWM
uniref:Zn(2)-C6 fungal-type domain-containing protein n=1 Tax=Bionectria ochroleuca TaxID=29856 RepID=A0A8H7KAI5_BIOOC